MFCSNCGSEVVNGAKFCPTCGAKIIAANNPVIETTVVQEVPVTNPPIEPVVNSEVVRAVDPAPVPVVNPTIIVQGQPTEMPTKSKKSNKKILLIIPAVIVALFVAVIWISSNTPVNFYDTYYSEYGSSIYVDIGVDGSYISVDTNPYDIDGGSSSSTGVDIIRRLNNDMGFDEAVTQRMGKTRALDGTQTASTKLYTASWTFHPDKGLQVVYSHAK